MFQTKQYIDDNLEIRRLFFGKPSELPVTAWNKLLNREFINKNGLRFIEGVICEDQIWSFNLMQRCRSLAIIPDKTYRYNFVESSIINSLSFQKHSEIVCAVLEKTTPMISGKAMSLQVFYCITLLFDVYRGLKRKRYKKLTYQLSWILFKRCRPFLAMQILFYFRFFTVLNLRKYESSLYASFEKTYRAATKSLSYATEKS